MATRGMQVPTYAYAANNPLRYIDPSGLYSVDGDCTLPKEGDRKTDVEAAARKLARRIDDGSLGSLCVDDELRKCVLKQIDEMVVTCNANTRVECKKPSRKGAEIYAYAVAGRCNAVGDFVAWCNHPGSASVSCMAETLVHEAAHMCGWQHGDGHGVPGDDGFVCGGKK